MYGGANGELAEAMRYSIQGFNCEDPERKDLLMDIGTEELSHLEVVSALTNEKQPRPTPGLVDEFFNASTGKNGAAMRTCPVRGMKAAAFHLVSRKLRAAKLDGDTVRS